jgi:8-oxo-dGTP diphosphatase
LSFDPVLYVHGISIDCVVFGFHENQLKVLLLKTKGLNQWTLPGGFIFRDEDTDDAAHRMLRERTQLSNIFLKQFSFFGKASRNSIDFSMSLLKKNLIDQEAYEWMSQRFSTVGYFALVEYSKVNAEPDDFADQCQWFSPHDLPKLVLDHQEIIHNALSTLRLELKYYPVGINLLPKKFTMPELQALYETILDQKLDRRNFQRKMLSYGILKKLDEQRKGGAHKAPYLYMFDKKGYQEAMEKGLKAVW